MKRIRLLFCILLFWPITLLAQSSGSNGNIKASSTACLTTNSCVVLNLPTQADLIPGSATITVTGSFTGTLQFEESANNGTSWVAASGSTTPGGTLVTSTTTTGTWTFAIPAMTNLRVRASAFAIGTAAITLLSSPAAASGGTGGTGTVGNGSQFNPCYYDNAGTSTSCIGDPGFFLDPAAGTVFPAPSGTGVGFTITGDANNSNIFNVNLTGGTGGNAFSIDSLGNIIVAGTISSGSGTGIGCDIFYDSGGTNNASICAPSTVDTSYVMSLPTAQGQGSMSNDGAGNLSWVPVAAQVQSGDYLVSGGGVFCDPTTLFCGVAPAVYVINGVTYTSVQQTATLTTGDATDDRIEVVYLDNTGTVGVLPGTPAATPVKPQVDPTTQIELTFVTVAATATAPSVSNTDIYLENTEWTCTASANFNCASTSNPYAGTKDIEATTAVAGNNVTLLKPASGTENLSSYSILNLYVRSKAAWANPKALNLCWYGVAQTNIVGNCIALKTGAYGFNSSTTGSYQQVTIPTSAFGTGSTPVTELQLIVGGGGAAIGFYVDNIQLQSGQTINPPPAGGVTAVTGTAPIASSGGTTPAISLNAGGVTSTYLADANKYRTCTFNTGGTSATALVAADFAGWCTVPYAATVTEIDVFGGTGTIGSSPNTFTGTSSIQVEKNHAGSLTSLLSGDLATASGKACALSSGTAGTCIFYNGMTSSGTITVVTAGSANVLAAGDIIQVSAATPDTVQTWYSISIHYKVN